MSRFRFSYWLRILPQYAISLGLLLLLGLLALGIGIKLQERRPLPIPRNRLVVSVLNVGQGEAAWIRTPGGKCIVIGGGPPQKEPVLLESLNNASVKSVDLLILPYPYAEAIGSLPALLDALPVAQLWEAGGKPINESHRQVRRKATEHNVAQEQVRAGRRMVLDEVTIEVLAPGEPLLTASPVAANNSVVVRLTYGQTRFLFAGGLEARGEFALLSRQADISAQWLRVARFANRNASSPEFLRLVSPEIAVVSVGPNQDDYPHTETLSRLEATGAVLYRTDSQVAPLQFVSDGAEITIGSKH